MIYTVRERDTLWGIAAAKLGNGRCWPLIAKANNLRDPDMILVGQSLILPGISGKPVAEMRPRAELLGVATAGGRSPSQLPIQNHVFVLADEINPLSRKIVRRVIVNPKMAAEVGARIGKTLPVFANPEVYGFTTTGPGVSLAPGRHAQGIKPSPFVSAANGTFGARRFAGSPFWIDAAKAQAAGATIHETSEILADLDRIIAKTATLADKEKFKKLKEIVAADREVLVKGSVPPSAVKGGVAMAGTRVLQAVQVVGFALTAYNLTEATQKSVALQSPKPIEAQLIREAGGWAAAWAGMKVGAAAGAFVGVSTGPGALAFAAGGAVIGGFGGYLGFDWIADHIDAN